LLATLIHCNSSSPNEDAELETDTVSLTKKIPDANLVEATVIETKFNTDTNEIILFANMDRFIRAKDNISVLKGINTSLMNAILLKYIKNEHIDPNRNEKKVTDSVFVDLITSEFSYIQKTPSNLSEYDIAKQRAEDVDEALKNVKTYDRYMVKGKFKIKQVKLDIATIEFDGKINQLDAISYHFYGEDAPFNETSFKDTSNIDLMETFNELGGIKKLTKHDLEVTDSKKLKYLRNQFFARKGYIFKTDKMKNYFGKKEWYTPKYDDVSNSLSNTEKYNIEFIKQLEGEVK